MVANTAVTAGVEYLQPRWVRVIPQYRGIRIDRQAGIHARSVKWR
jgi:hypothetical protein